MRPPHSPCLAILLVALVATVAAHADAQTTASKAAPSQRNVTLDAWPSEVFKALYSGDPGRAVRVADEHLKEHPRDVKVLVLSARAHLAREEYDEAYELLEKALTVDAQNADALYFLGIVSAQMAAHAFDRVYAIAPDGARVHQLMARSLRLQEKPLEAAAEYELALQANPNSLDALLEFARLRREESSCQEAIALYERAQRVKPTYDGAYGLGVCLATLNDHSRAVEQFRNALTHDRNSAAAEFGLGSSLLQMGDAPAAAAALERAARLAPRMRETYYVLGRAYQKMGQSERAQQAFARAAALAQAERAGGAKATTRR
jgi:tetratricopeptide (TPR) repeat protein